MKKDFFSNKKSIVAIFSIVFLLVSFSLIFKSQAQELAESSLSAFLKVKEYALFGGGVTIGLNNPINALIVQSGKVGIGTTNPASLLTVDGEMEVAGKIKAQGGYENPLTCPTLLTTVSVSGNVSWPGQNKMRYNGYVAPYGVYVDEESSNDDERLFWEDCQENPANRTVTFTSPVVYDGAPDSIFILGERNSIIPSFKNAIGSSNALSASKKPIIAAVSSGDGFCNELGLDYVQSSSSPSGSYSNCTHFYSNRWLNYGTCNLIFTEITCAILD